VHLATAVNVPGLCSGAGVVSWRRLGRNLPWRVLNSLRGTAFCVLIHAFFARTHPSLPALRTARFLLQVHPRCDESWLHGVRLKDLAKSASALACGGRRHFGMAAKPAGLCIPRT
jgi:hypothetical protein